MIIFKQSAQGKTFKQKLNFWQPETKNHNNTNGINIKINRIFEWYKRISSEIKSIWNEHFKIVCWRKLRYTFRHKEAHRKCNDNGKSKYNFEINETETEHKKQHWIGTFKSAMLFYNRLIKVYWNLDSK